MRYAENNQISHRQLFRQIFLAFLAPVLLCLPGDSVFQGKSAILGAGAGLVLLGVYGFWMGHFTPWFGDPVKALGKIPGRLLGMFFLSYVIFTGAWLLELMGRLVPYALVTGIPGTVIIFLAVAVCSVGTTGGMQRRGRAAEVTGGVVLAGMALMLILCLGQSRGAYFREMAELSSVTGEGAWKSFYGILCAFSGISLLLFAMKDVERRNTAGKAVLLGIFTVGGVLLGTIVLLPGVLGWKRLKAEAYPVLPLLAGADLPGNVLARFDVLWMGFLLYSLLFAVGSLFHYGHQILGKIRIRGGVWWLPAAVYLLAVAKLPGQGIRQLYGAYLGYVFVPGLILIQASMMLYKNKKRQKRAAACILFTAVLTVSGCAAIEPEKRMFPLALGAAETEEGVELIYGMPDLPQATGQEKQEDGKNVSVLPIAGKDFSEIEKKYDRSQEKYLDMSHLQVILVGTSLLESGKAQEFLEYLKEEPFVGENVYLFRTPDPLAVLSWDKSGTSVGEYLTGLLENRLPEKQKEGVTLRQVYHRWYQDGTLEELPLILLEQGELQVYLQEV